MLIRTAFVSLLAMLCACAGAAAAAEVVDLGGWASREDRLLIVFLLDGFDEERVDAWDRNGDALLPGMKGLRSSAIVFEDVQSGAIGAAPGLQDLFGDTAPEVTDGSPAELNARLRRAAGEGGAHTLVLATDLFRDPRDLDDNLLMKCDPAPWAIHQPGYTSGMQKDARSRRAEMLQRLYEEGRPIRRGTTAEDLEWIGDAMHSRADSSLRPVWDALAETGVRERSLIVISARVGPADPQRGAPAPPSALRPDLVDIPFWLLTPAREAARVTSPTQSGPLLRSLRALAATATTWQPPESVPSRFSFHAPSEPRPATAAILWRRPEFSLLLRSDSAHELYDRRSDPGEWENLAAQQSGAVTLLKTRAARELLGERISVSIYNAGGGELLIQPAASVENLQGDGWRREGPLLRLQGEGPWTFEVDSAVELRVRSPLPTASWYLGENFSTEAAQITIALTRPELQHGLDWRKAPSLPTSGVQILLRAGEGGILHRP